MRNLQKFEMFEIHAEFCRAMSHPARLRILNEIGDIKITVGELAGLLDLRVSNVSQHLKILKNYEIVKSDRIGHKVYYYISDKRIVEICQGMRVIISDLHDRKKKIFNKNKDKFGV